MTSGLTGKWRLARKCLMRPRAMPTTLWTRSWGRNHSWIRRRVMINETKNASSMSFCPSLRSWMKKTGTISWRRSNNASWWLYRRSGVWRKARTYSFSKRKTPEAPSRIRWQVPSILSWVRNSIKMMYLEWEAICTWQVWTRNRVFIWAWRGGKRWGWARWWKAIMGGWIHPAARTICRKREMKCRSTSGCSSCWGKRLVKKIYRKWLTLSSSQRRTAILCSILLTHCRPSWGFYKNRSKCYCRKRIKFWSRLRIMTARSLRCIKLEFLIIFILFNFVLYFYFFKYFLCKNC